MSLDDLPNDIFFDEIFNKYLTSYDQYTLFYLCKNMHYRIRRYIYGAVLSQTRSHRKHFMHLVSSEYCDDDKILHQLCLSYVTHQNTCVNNAVQHMCNIRDIAGLNGACERGDLIDESSKFCKNMVIHALKNRHIECARAFLRYPDSAFDSPYAFNNDKTREIVRSYLVNAAFTRDKNLFAYIIRYVIHCVVPKKFNEKLASLSDTTITKPDIIDIDDNAFYLTHVIKLLVKNNLLDMLDCFSNSVVLDAYNCHNLFSCILNYYLDLDLNTGNIDKIFSYFNKQPKKTKPTVNIRISHNFNVQTFEYIRSALLRCKMIYVFSSGQDHYHSDLYE